MGALINYFKGEPVAMIIGGVYAVFQALIELLISFHVALSTQQVIALNGFVLAILVLVARGQVTPSQITGAAQQPPAGKNGG
jgi:hypothetical protein